jgi:D-alanyl-D-alanine carboxypeptidase
VVAGCAGSESSPLQGAARETAEELVRAGAQSAIVSVSERSESFVAASGRDAQPDARFRVGSVTKTFTAAVVLQLVQEGAVRLDDPVSRYLPELVPRARGVTVRHLLGHRSGLVNFTEYIEWLNTAERSTTTGVREVVRFAVSKAAAFRAGTSFAYSNTNYIVLGLLIEKLTGNSYAEELGRRIFEPLELEHTELATTARLPDLDDEGTNPHLPWASGGIVSDARDIARFYSALLSGTVLSPGTLAAMRHTVQADGPVRAGLGIFASTTPCGDAWGHEGAILDYWTDVAATEDGDRVVVVSVRSPPWLAAPPPTAELVCAAG